MFGPYLLGVVSWPFYLIFIFYFLPVRGVPKVHVLADAPFSVHILENLSPNVIRGEKIEWREVKKGKNEEDRGKRRGKLKLRVI
jgi:hypothetical protein